MTFQSSMVTSAGDIESKPVQFFGKRKIKKAGKKYETVIIKGVMLFNFILLLYLSLLCSYHSIAIYFILFSLAFLSSSLSIIKSNSFLTITSIWKARKIFLTTFTLFFTGKHPE